MNCPLILVVEDDPVSMEVTVATLEAGGFSVEQARDGIEALEMAAMLTPDLILLDLLLPKLSGYQVYRRLQRQPEMQEIPCLFVTGAAQSDISLPRPMWERILTKPVRPSTLIERVKALLS